MKKTICLDMDSCASADDLRISVLDPIPATHAAV